MSNPAKVSEFGSWKAVEVLMADSTLSEFMSTMNMGYM